MEDARRFTLVEAPAHAPAVDYITRSAVGPFIDTGKTIYFDRADTGRLYLSVDTIREMAEMAGLLSEEKLPSVAVREKQWYDKGYADAVLENIGGTLRDVVDRLGFVADRLSDLDRSGDAQGDAALADQGA